MPTLRAMIPAAVLSFALPVAVLGAAAFPAGGAAQGLQPPVSATFEDTALRDVVRFFADYAGRSIVLGAGVEGVVSADIVDQPWDAALAAILGAHGLVGRELESGIIVVTGPREPAARVGELRTRVFRLNWVRAEEIQPAVQSMLTERGTVAVLPGLNALVVTDEAGAVGRVAGLVGG